MINKFNKCIRRVMRIKSKKTLFALNQRLRKKALQVKLSNYHICAAAYTRKGNLLGIASNNINRMLPYSRKGGGVHAERELMKKFGTSISYIIISRTGRSGDNTLPIHPCATCAKLANRLNIKILMMHELLENFEKGEIKDV